MKERRIDLSDKRFGKLLVLRFSHLNAKRYALWLCRCECGTEKPVRSDLLRSGKAVSCGCSSPRFKPGERPSKATEFQPGQEAHNRMPLGSITTRTDVHGKPRAWVKVGEPNKWRQRAVVVWEEANGPLPRGKVVHHKDRDTLNDSLENLVALTPSEHLREHRGENESARVLATKTKTWATRRANSRA